MTDVLDARKFQARLQRLDELIGEVERFHDPAAKAHTRGIVQALLELHGAGLERILDRLAHEGSDGSAILESCANDDVIGGLLLLHGLHPLSLEERVLQALEQVRPHLRSHGGNVDLIGISDGVVQLRLVGSCDGCPSSAVTMRQTIEEAIVSRAPDAISIEVEGAPEAALAGDMNGRARIALTVL